MKKAVIISIMGTGLSASEFEPEIRRQGQVIRDALSHFERLGCCRVVILKQSSLEEIRSVLNGIDKKTERLRIIHLSGHSTSKSIAKMIGLPGQRFLIWNQALIECLMPFLNEIKLVFWDGCDSIDISKDFLKAGIGAVIASISEVDKREASLFSQFFYEKLSEPRSNSLIESFQSASLLFQEKKIGKSPWVFVPHPSNPSSNWKIKCEQNKNKSSKNTFSGNDIETINIH